MNIVFTNRDKVAGLIRKLEKASFAPASLRDDAPGKFVTSDSALERSLRSSPPDLEFFKRKNKMKMSQQAGSNPRPQDH